MRNDCQSSKKSNMIISHKGSGYQNTINKVMQAITNQNHPTTASSHLSIMTMMVIMSITFVVMTMAQ